MSMHRGALVGVVVLFLILSTSVIVLMNKEGLPVFQKRSKIYSNDIGEYSSENEVAAQVTPRLPGIAITFNGWAIDDWYNMSSLLISNNATATFFVGKIESLTSTDFEKLRALKYDGNEIGISGFRYVNAVDYVRNHTLQDYIDEEITPAIEIMSNNDLFPTSFAYPYGSRNSTIDAELLKYFLRLRSTAYTSNTTRIVNLDSVFYKWQDEALIRGVGMDSEYGNTIEEITQGLERAQQSDEVIVLYGHTPIYNSPDYGTPAEKLLSIIQEANALNLVFYRVSDLVLPTTSTTTTSTDNGGNITNTQASVLNDLVISIIISCVGIGFLWVLASFIFPKEQK